MEWRPVNFSANPQISLTWILILLQQPKSAAKASLSPVFVTSEQGLDASGQANIQTAATKVTNIGERLALAASVLLLSVVN